MDTTTYVQVCAPADMNTSAGVCSNPQWEPQPSFFPSLSVADGGTIASAILACWAVAHGYKVLTRAI